MGLPDWLHPCLFVFLQIRLVFTVISTAAKTSWIQTQGPNSLGILSTKEAAVLDSLVEDGLHCSLVLPPDDESVTTGIFMSSRGHSTLPRTLMAPRMISEGDIGGIAQITSSLFLGRASVASNRHLLQARGITCVVNATIEIPNFNWPQFEYVKVPLADIPHAPIRLYFDTVADKIHSVSKKHGATLVHCAAGVSRSATLCIAYLMKFHNLCLLEAYNWVKARRPVIRPNLGFWRQLIDYESQLFGKSSVKMVHTPYGIIPDVYEKESRHLMPYWGI